MTRGEVTTAPWTQISEVTAPAPGDRVLAQLPVLAAMLSTISRSKGISWRGGTSRVDSRERITGRRLPGGMTSCQVPPPPVERKLMR